MLEPLRIGLIKGGLLLIQLAMSWLLLATRRTADLGSKMREKKIIFLTHILLCIFVYGDMCSIHIETNAQKIHDKKKILMIRQHLCYSLIV